MPDVNALIYEFLNREGVSILSKALLSKVNSRIEERIVQTLDENADATHVPSAIAVFNAINSMSHIKFKTHTGPIDEVGTPNSSYIYLQRDNEADQLWMMYVYDLDLGWINIGDTEVDLSNYWSKDAADVEAMKLALGLPETIQELKDMIAAAEARLNESITNLDAKVDEKVVELTEKIDNLPVNLMFNDNGSFAIYLKASDNISLVDYILNNIERPGMYTIYAQRGCPDNPVSPVDSSFRGICHIDPLAAEDQSTENAQKLYGWIMLFDQEGRAHVNYIRRSVASGWQCLNDAANLAAEVARLEAEMTTKVGETQMVALTVSDINAAVDGAYSETAPAL